LTARYKSKSDTAIESTSNQEQDMYTHQGSAGKTLSHL